MKFKIIPVISIALMIFVNMVILNADTHAVSGTCFFKTGAGGGIVTNDGVCGVVGSGSYGENDVLTGRDAYGSGSAIPSDVNSKATFIDFIINKFNNGSDHDKIGTAFLIDRMLRVIEVGNDFPTSTDISDWTSILNMSSVTVARVDNVNVGSTSYYDSGKNNVFFGDHDTVSRTIIEIRFNGAVMVQIETSCGNLVANPLIIIPKVWSLSATSTADRATASPGDTITWTHVLKNDGPTPTDTDVTYHYQDRDGLGSGQGPDGIFQSGSAKDTTRIFYSTYTVRSGDIGNLCRATSASPKAKGDNGWLESARACVSVTSTPTTNVCRPMIVNVASPGTDYLGVVAINVTTRNNADGTTRFIGSNPYSSTIDITGTHTTGDQYTVTQVDARQWATHNYHFVSGGPPPWFFGWWTIDFSGPYTRGSSIIGPCYNYKLTAVINSFSNRVEPDATIVLSPSVGSSPMPNVNAPQTKSKPTKWQITQMVIPPNVSTPAFVANSNSSLSPCDYFDPNRFSQQCTVQSSNSSTVFNTAGTPSVSLTSSYKVLDMPAGTKICFAFSVYPSQSDPRNDSSLPGPNDQWNHATFDPANNCVIVVKKPKTQIWGGDLWSSKSVDTSTSTKNISTFGSWAEYGIFATGTVSGMASGSAFSGLLGLANANASGCNYSILTFTNAGSSTCGISAKGNYQNVKTIPDIAASFPVTNSTPSLTGSVSLNNLQGVYQTNGNISISGGSIQKGEWIVINAPTATVTIAGDIKYTNAVINKISEVPQVVIIAKKIIINNNAKNVDAWLIAIDKVNKTGEIDTCEVVGDSINRCANLLIVNGPVMTDHLRLYRTAGSGTDVHSGDPAEVFNLRADAYLWAYSQAKSSSRVQTVYTTELPPRF